MIAAEVEPLELGEIQTLRDAGPLLMLTCEHVYFATWASPLGGCIRTANERANGFVAAAVEQPDWLLRESATILAAQGVPRQDLQTLLESPYHAARRTLVWGIDAMQRDQSRAPLLFGRRQHIQKSQKEFTSTRRLLAELESQDHARSLETENHSLIGPMMVDEHVADVPCAWTFTVGSSGGESADALFAEPWEAQFFHFLFEAYGERLRTAGRLLDARRSQSDRAALLHDVALRLQAGHISEVALMHFALDQGLPLPGSARPAEAR